MIKARCRSVQTGRVGTSTLYADGRFPYCVEERDGSLLGQRGHDVPFDDVVKLVQRTLDGGLLDYDPEEIAARQATNLTYYYPADSGGVEFWKDPESYRSPSQPESAPATLAIRTRGPRALALYSPAIGELQCLNYVTEMLRTYRKLATEKVPEPSSGELID